MNEDDYIRGIIDHRLEVLQLAVNEKKFDFATEKKVQDILNENKQSWFKEVDLNWYRYSTNLIPYLRPIYADALKKYSITIDYNQTVVQMIDSGKFEGGSIDWLKKNLTVEGSGKKTIDTFIYSFSRRKKIREIKFDLKKFGMRLVAPEEIIIFGATYPDIQRVCGFIYSQLMIEEKYPDSYRIVIYGGPNHDEYYRHFRGIGSSLRAYSEYYLVTKE